jgi:hypothetical protein
MPSRIARFVVLYYSHILTTIPLPLALLVFRIVNVAETISLVLFLAGFWTLVGAALMTSKETRQLRRSYVVGASLVLVSSLTLFLNGLRTQVLVHFFTT